MTMPKRGSKVVGSPIARLQSFFGEMMVAVKISTRMQTPVSLSVAGHIHRGPGRLLVVYAWSVVAGKRQSLLQCFVVEGLLMKDR